MTSSTATLSGIHHVTAITADGRENLRFYTDLLGLRLVKKTVNFDDPGSYHLYYGDELGRPGTILTFFVWTGGRRGRIGPPQVTETALAVPPGSLHFWRKRLEEGHCELRTIEPRFGDHALGFSDPDGLRLELIETDNPGAEPWASGPIPADVAIRGVHSVSVSQEGYEKTAHLLTDMMDFTLVGSENNRFRYRASYGSGFASVVDLLCQPDLQPGGMGAGAVHHVAFRTPDDAQQATWRRTIVGEGLNVSPVMDRNYFHSIYFREPGGVLFEIATDSPGFTVDEPAEQLGQGLMLPVHYESIRPEIEKRLPPLK